jgi:hypothetical protein
MIRWKLQQNISMNIPTADNNYSKSNYYSLNNSSHLTVNLIKFNLCLGQSLLI